MDPMTPLANVPLIVDADTEINNLANALGNINGQIHEIKAKLRTQADFAEDMEADHVAAALLSLKTGRVETTRNIPDDLADEHRTLLTRRDKVQAALLKRQQARERMAGDLSADVSRDAAKAHKKLAAHLAAVLREVDELLRQERTFIGEIEAAGYSAQFAEYLAWPLMDGTPFETKLRDLDSYARA